MQHILWALLSCSYSSEPQDLHGSDPEKHRPSEAQMLASGICVPHVHPGTWDPGTWEVWGSAPDTQHPRDSH